MNSVNLFRTMSFVFQCCWTLVSVSGLYNCSGFMLCGPLQANLFSSSSLCTPICFFIMRNVFKSWNVLCWNIRGMNADTKLLSLRQKIEESGCHVFYVQETKKQNFTIPDIKTFAPKRFDAFAFSPSRGASGGILVVWVSNVFLGTPGEINSFSVTVNFVSRQSSEAWTLTCIYGPCSGPERSDFVAWLKNFSFGSVDNIDSPRRL